MANLPVARPEAPSARDVAPLAAGLQAALADIRADPERGLASRLGAPHRQASAKVREVLQQQW